MSKAKKHELIQQAKQALARATKDIVNDVECDLESNYIIAELECTEDVANIPVFWDVMSIMFFPKTVYTVAINIDKFQILNK